MRLLTYCPDEDVLALASARLGVPRIDDPSADRSGHRYARAVRVFGRVKVEAYTEIPETAP